MSDGAPLLAARDLEVAFGRGPDGFRLRVDELELRAGQALAVLGPNGAGKSTLLRTLAGLLPPGPRGAVRSPGRDVALVFQRPVLLAGNVAYNAELPLWARGVPRAERRRRARVALEEFGIGALARRSAQTLSGGEGRRLALARAFVTEPDVLLLDEPFDDLDDPGREALSLDLRRAIDERGIAVAMVTHDLRQALLLADRIAVLRAGRLVQVGARDEVLRSPADPGVARLVGMTNLLAAEVTQADGGRLRLRLANGRVLSAAGRAAPGAPVWVGVRPENVRLEPARGDLASSDERAEVVRLVSDGVVATAWLAWDGVELRTHLVAGRGLGQALKPGAPVAISIRAEDVHVMPRGQNASEK